VDPALYPVIIFVIIWVIFAIVTATALIRNKALRFGKRYHYGRHTYAPGEFSPQMELDLRLPYKRFKQLYPSTRLTYEEYKKLQMKRAFRRSMSAQDNKRMVR
jgi:hypothetical protein